MGRIIECSVSQPVMTYLQKKLSRVHDLADNFVGMSYCLVVEATFSYLHALYRIH